MWSWLEEQYPAPGYSPYKGNSFPPLSGSDASASMRLVASGASGNEPDETDVARAAQAAREAGAAAIARAVRPPEGRDEGWLTRAPEDWVRRMLRGPYSGYPAWPSPANPASPFPPPPSPAAPVSAPIYDEKASEAQAEREAVARTVANAARHPYGKVFDSIVPNNAPAETEDPRQAQLAREAWARKLANDVRPPDGRQDGPTTRGLEYLGEKAWDVGVDAIIGAALQKAFGPAGREIRNSWLKRKR
jgi:hypothetical protein